MSVRLEHRRQVLRQADCRCVARKGELDSAGRQVVSDRVLDYAQELLGPVGTTDGKLVQKLHHEATEALESTRDADVRVDLNQDTLRSVDVHLKQARLV